MTTLAFIFLSLLSTNSEDLKYPVSDIPEENKKGMYAVIREKELKYDINSISSSTTYYHTAITILNENGKDYAYLGVSYDKYNMLKSFKASVYDASGKLIKKLKQSEISDRSAYDGVSLFSDDRVKSADLSQAVYPYTVEFEYEVQNKSLFYIPSFTLYSDDEVFIQKTKYSLVYPVDLKPRYQLFKIAEPVLGKGTDKNSLTWHFEDIRPEKFEKMGPGFKKIVPHILVAPDSFSFDEYQGKMDSWDNYGKWQILLNTGRETLPESAKATARQLTKDATTTEQKAQILYKYLQGKTRYVGVQLGIGGWQPFEASVVDQTGYGDCKALSNYMVALLKEVGVKGYYTIIYAGDGAADINTTFPSNQFNHVIVSVPNAKDTLWLECTSQTNPFGYAGSFTGNRHALMVTEDGGKIVKTPTYSSEQNVQSITGDITIELTGDAKAKVKSIYSGLQYENNNLNFVINQSNEQQKKWVQNNTPIPVFDVLSFSMNDQKNKVPSVTVNRELALKKYASVSGKRIFVNPNLMNRSTFIPEKLENRKTDVVIKMPYIDVDTMHYHLPEGIYPEFLPQPIKVKSRFGEYEAGFKLDNNGLIYTRKVKMNSGTFPAESYNELIDFYKNMNKADNTKIVFLSKT